MKTIFRSFISILFSLYLSSVAYADESVLGYVKGSETLPEGAWEFDQTITFREGKGAGDYEAWNTKTEIEYGVSNRFTVSAYLKAQAIDSSGIIIDGYLPQDKDRGLEPSGTELSLKYNFLSPAKDDFGLSGYVSFGYDWLDTHSGQDKDSLSMETELLLQKYFMEGQVIWMGNLGLETTHARRADIPGLPAGFDWPTNAEMEIELKAGTGVSYRFAPNWFIGVQALYETEYETEVSQERWTIFVGPSLHYGGSNWWGTFTWFPQVIGGGEMFPAQDDKNLHLIEKTEQEFQIKFGIDF
tara:strand:+ start:9634 stop:10530 length:897 start_codon:yes stop_codon:yes gene_type:complete